MFVGGVFFFFLNRPGVVFSFINTEYVVPFCDVIRRRVLMVRDVGLAEISLRCRGFGSWDVKHDMVLWP